MQTSRHAEVQKTCRQAEWQVGRSADRQIKGGVCIVAGLSRYIVSMIRYDTILYGSH